MCSPTVRWILTEWRRRKPFLKDWCFCRPVYRVKEEEDKELSNQEFSKTAMAEAAVEDRRKLLLWLNDRGMEAGG